MNGEDNQSSDDPPHLGKPVCSNAFVVVVKVLNGMTQKKLDTLSELIFLLLTPIDLIELS